jgi:Tol biopolymer transport system component
MVFSLSPDGDGGAHLMLLDLGGEERAARPLTSPTQGEASDTYPRFSPTGEDVAFIRTGRSGLSDVYRVGLADGQPHRLTKGQINVWGLDWNPRGDDVYFSSFAGGPYALSAVSIADRTVQRVPVLAEWVRYPTLARDADRLVFESRRETQDILRLSLDPDRADASETEPLVVSNSLDCEPSWSPDGDRIAFISTRTGFRELWVCDSGGSGLRQLTALAGAYVDAPVWSPDGETLVFRAAGDDIAMYAINYVGGSPRRLSPDGHHALPCSWSRDGQRVYYACDVGGDWQIWYVDPDSESGDPMPVTTEGGVAAIESADGETLYLVLPDRTGIWRRPIAGGEPECVVDGLPASQFQSWAVTAAGIYYVRPQDAETAVLFHDLSRDETTEIATIPSYPSPRFSIAPDGRSLLFVRSDHLDIDLKLIDGYGKTIE